MYLNSVIMCCQKRSQFHVKKCKSILTVLFYANVGYSYSLQVWMDFARSIFNFNLWYYLLCSYTKSDDINVLKEDRLYTVVVTVCLCNKSFLCTVSLSGLQQLAFC